jgi:hypothetical protein
MAGEYQVPDNQNINPISLEDLSLQIFSHDPQPPNSQQILIQQVIEDPSNTIVDIFEIFMTLLVEGMLIVYQHPSWDQVKNFQEDHILNLKPWLQSLGFTIHVSSYDRKLDLNLYKQYYCKIVLNCDPEWKTYFTIKHIQKEYHFVFGNESPYMKKTVMNLDTLYTIFICGNNVYKINFAYHR